MCAKLAQQPSTFSRVVPQIPFSSDFINVVIQNFLKMKDLKGFCFPVVYEGDAP